MGIKHYFIWLKKNFPEHLHKLNKDQQCSDIGVNIDDFFIDMNGVFHSSTQKIYEYGNNKKPKRLLRKPKQQNRLKLQNNVFADVCQTVENLLQIVKPKKRLILCVDGPAPIAKQCVTGDSLVTMSDGTSKYITDINEGDYVLGWNGNLMYWELLTPSTTPVNVS